MIRRGILPLLLACLLLAALPVPARAYLDPGTGNVLIYAAISILGASAYLIKGLWYRLRGLAGFSRTRKEAVTGHDELVLFSEGKPYWLTFKPVIEALLRRNRPFRYLSMDIEDPALEIEDERMRSRYIGEGSAAFARACSVRARVMLATTPNIGTPGYPMPAPRGVDCLAHILHGVGDVGMYHKYSLDRHQAVLMMGDFMLDSIRRLERLRGLPEKECVSVGMPYFDEMARRVDAGAATDDPATVLFAPSWGAKSCLGPCGALVVGELLDAGFAVILRPHPQSFRVEKTLVDALTERFAAHPRFALDTALSGTASMNRARLLVSDASGVRFDFAFLDERPVITLAPEKADMAPYDASDLEYIWEDEAARMIGPVVPARGLASVLPLVERALAMPAGAIAGYRDRHMACPGRAGEAVADWAVAKIAATGGKPA